MRVALCQLCAQSSYQHANHGCEAEQAGRYIHFDGNIYLAFSHLSQPIKSWLEIC